MNLTLVPKSPSLRREPLRRLLRRALLVSACVLVAPQFLPEEAVGQAHVMRGGTVGIQNDTEKQLFFSLICMCGCPRETLGTCTCEYGGERRDELRAMLQDGMSIQAVQKAYAARFGSQSLAVPPNEGASRLIWLAPLVAVLAAAFLVIRLMRRWAARGAEKNPVPLAAGKGANKRDEYDDKLDDELRELDRE